MLKRYRNGFIDVIKEAGLSPTDFHAEENERGGTAEFIISFRDTPFKFVTSNLRPDQHHFRCFYTIFAPDFPMSSTVPRAGFVMIQIVYIEFKNWLTGPVTDYIDDLMTPDLWAQIEKAKPLVTGDKISGDELTNFSEEEKIQLRLSINEFRLAIISNFSPSEEKMRIVEDRLHYLGEALDRLNRFDWRGIALSTILSITIALSLDTEKGRLLYELFKRAFATILRYLQ